jgi:flavin-dependent dehydrogenase
MLSGESDADVLICGGGPAGAIAAVVLARAGARVVVLDRGRFPRDKLCGDTLNPGALAVLRRLALEHLTHDGLPLDGMIVTGGTGVRVQGRLGPGIHGRALRRYVLDARLLQAAATAGACVEEGVRVDGALVDAGRVIGLAVGGSSRAPRRLRAPLVIAADGANSRIARSLNLIRHPTWPRRWAVGAYFEGAASAGASGVFGEMHVRSGRYIGVAPLPGGLTNACVVTADRQALRDPVALLQATLRGDPQLAGRFATARPAGRPACLGPLAVDSSASGMPGLLLAGDAAGFIDPMTGDGLRFAMRGGELAARAALRALEHGHPDAHAWLARARRLEFSSKWRFNRAMRALVGSPAAVRAAAVTAAVSPRWLQYAIRYAGDVRAR